jgi:predicted ABC-type exoprotein transport system permease subunit
LIYVQAALRCILYSLAKQRSLWLQRSTIYPFTMQAERRNGVNSSEPSATKKVKQWGLAPLRFNWIEVFAVPVAVSIMESQPIIVILAIFAPLFSGSGEVVQASEITITLLLLGLQWWAMLGRWLVQRGTDERKIQPFHIGGLVLALVLVIVLGIEHVSNFLAFFLLVALVVWCWKRGLDWARTGLDDEHIITTFRVGFCVLLVGLVVGILLLNMASPLMLVVLSQALPLFFMSGLIGLSFTRLGLVRRENARHAPAGTDPTRSWLTILTLVWGCVVVAAIALEAFSFQSILAIAPFFWNALGTVVGWIIYALYFLLSPLFSWLFSGGQFPAPTSRPNGPKPKPQLPPHIVPISPEAVLAGRIVLLLVVLVVLVLVVRFIVKKWRIVQEEDEEEEERESLPMQEILKMRREERRKKRKDAVAVLEVVDPDSARARYRELLQSVAGSNEKLARHANETPVEYEARLLARVTRIDDSTEQVPPDATILGELTHAYVRERYGGKQTDLEQRNYFSTWIPRLIKRLTGSIS